jgi:hypothetical protein
MALYDDALAVVAAEVESGYMWPVGIWERPSNAGDDYEHPKHEVDQAAVSELLTRMTCGGVLRSAVDPVR